MSIFPKIPQLEEEIRNVYRHYQLPWVIGYSGGKDSTATLQLVWKALLDLAPEERTKPIYVISTDTQVETPVIVERIQKTHKLINAAAKEAGLPLTAHRLSPVVNDSFWVNLIGRGYPAPNNAFRWCTSRLKIAPSNQFILDKVTEHGEVILALGSRRGESVTRDQVLDMHRITGHKLARHGQLPNSWVFMPIEHFTTDDVWTYLMQVDNPWGDDNLQLSALYRSAHDGECPLVVDDKTASCGNSRFGCWVCTVVTRDRSMEAMIDAGEEWMVPLLNYRDWLSSTLDPEIKPLQREFRGRDGRIKITDSGKLRWRTYTLDFSKRMLRRLLETQREMQEDKPDETLISEVELHEIRRIWQMERQDWEDSLPKIYSDVVGEEGKWVQNDGAMPGALEAGILAKLVDDHDVPLPLVQKLLDAEWQHYGMRRRGKIHKQIDKFLGWDWRDKGMVDEAILRRQEQANA